MSVKQTFSDLLHRDMDRREFFAHTGAAVLTLVGVAGLLKAVDQLAHPKQTIGYGSGGYGGEAKQRAQALQAKNRVS